MSSVVIIRGAGDVSGDEIVEALLYDTAARIERGRVEMDEHATVNQNVTLTILYRPGLRLGQLVEVGDSVQGAAWRGKIVGINHKYEQSSLVTTIDVKRPQEFF